MTEPNELPLEWFKDLQGRKLSTAKNVAKKHWLDMTERQLLIRVMEEVSELTVAITGKHGSEAIVDECVDVANFCAMLAHKVTHTDRPEAGR